MFSILFLSETSEYCHDWSEVGDKSIVRCFEKLLICTKKHKVDLQKARLSIKNLFSDTTHYLLI